MLPCISAIWASNLVGLFGKRISDERQLTGTNRCLIVPDISVSAGLMVEILNGSRLTLGSFLRRMECRCVGNLGRGIR